MLSPLEQNKASLHWSEPLGPAGGLSLVWLHHMYAVRDRSNMLLRQHYFLAAIENVLIVNVAQAFDQMKLCHRYISANLVSF